MKKNYFQYEWNVEPNPIGAEAVRRLRRAQNPAFMPSGIPNLTVEAGDHIAVIALDDGDKYLSLVADFISSGIQSGAAGLNSEIVSLELSVARNSSEMRDMLAERLGRNPAVDDVDIRDAERNYSDYDLELFSREGMLRAISYEAERFKSSSRTAFRCASEDCSYFLRSISNPSEYLNYEYRLMSDLNAVIRRPALQLCVFRMGNLEILHRERGLLLHRSLRKIIRSHSKIIAVNTDRISVEAEAKRSIRRRTSEYYGGKIGWLRSLFI